MFRHMYVNGLKIFLREKVVVFWLLVFPMILAVFFKMGFSGLMDGESFETLKTAIVVTDENESVVAVYKSIFSQMGDTMNVKYTDLDSAEEMLDNEEIEAYFDITVTDGIPRLSMNIKENLINQSIIKEIADKINEGVSLVMSGSVDEKDILSIMNVDNVINNVQISGQKQDYIAAWFYTILGMAAMYGSILGIFSVRLIQANQSAEAMRFNLAPVSKMKGFVAIFAAGATIHAANMIIIYLYLRYIMSVNFGSRQGYIILVSVIAGFTGVAVGALIGVLVKSGENLKIGICMAVSMMGSYLAGMMDNSMKYRVMKNVPVLEYINPVGIVTDAYLKLFYYKDLNHFWGDVINLLVIMAVCMTASILVLRRQRYDNI